ncbi:MAG: LytTR family DNA-binding domain-containing protein [bacterium]
MKALIIDDEKLACTRLRRMLKKYDQIEISGEAYNGKEALELIKKISPDVIFLDIKMPLLSGFEMLQRLKKPPAVIFTTAFDQYALQAFEENAVDYLVKPVSEEKLDRAVTKLFKLLGDDIVQLVDWKQLLVSIRKKEDAIKRFSVRTGDRMLIVPVEDVIYFKAKDKYTFLHTDKDSHIIPFTLRKLEDQLEQKYFIRVHRSAIVNIDHIQSIHRWFAGKLKLKMNNGKELIVSQGYVKEFRKKIHL